MYVKNQKFFLYTKKITHQSWVICYQISLPLREPLFQDQYHTIESPAELQFLE